MDFKNTIEYRKDGLEQYTATGDIRYNYQKNGILNKCLPKILFKGNAILVTFLQLIDVRIIILLKYIDKLKKFKYICDY